MDYALSKFYKEVIPQFVKRRNELGYTQTSLDAHMNIARGLVSKWETGIRKPSGFLFCCWAEALGCDLIIIPKKNPRKIEQELSVNKIKKGKYEW